MEYKTYGNRAVKLEKWPISSFGPSVNQSVTIISARDASASENLPFQVSNSRIYQPDLPSLKVVGVQLECGFMGLFQMSLDVHSVPLYLDPTHL